MVNLLSDEAGKANLNYEFLIDPLPGISWDAHYVLLPLSTSAGDSEVDVVNVRLSCDNCGFVSLFSAEKLGFL